MSYRLFTPIVLVCMVTGVLASCESEPTAEEISEEWVRTTLEGMSLSRLISQLFIVAVPGSETGFKPESFEQLRNRVADFEAGGVSIRSSPLEQAAVMADLQESYRIPLLVSRDMGWGAATRVEYATEFPRPLAIVATGNSDYAFETGRITAKEALAVGVNLILAPGADANSDPGNSVIGAGSFGDSPEVASEYVRRFIQGVQHAGGVGAMMTAHVANPDSETDSLVPATLSESLLGPLLRDRLGFEGLIVSDARNMTGLGDDNPGDFAVLSIDAGVDMLLVSLDPEAAYEAIIAGVQEGRLSETRIRESVERILRAKATAGLHHRSRPVLDRARSILRRPEHRSLASEVARQSIVLLRNNELIPLAGSSRSILLVSLVESGRPEKELVREIQRRYKGPLATRVVDPETWRQAIDSVVKDARNHDIVLMADQASEFRPRPKTVRAILDRLTTARRPLIFASMGSPYSAAGAAGRAGAIVVSFGSTRVSARAVSEALFGESAICGRLPVRLSETLERGAGLCLPQTVPRRGLPGEVGMSTRTLRNLDPLLLSAIADSAFPAAAIAVGRAGVIAHMDGYGRYTYESGENVTPGSLFDLASLTKVIATTTAIMQLYESERISLDDPVSRFIPAFAESGKGGITVRHLLTHTSGLIPFRRFYEIDGADRDTVLTGIMADSLVYEPESTYRYSDFGPIVLALIVEIITGQSFEAYTHDHIFEPLGMHDTGFRRVPGKADPSIVPTERDDYFRNRLVQGVVHDETAYLLGGTAGHAGLFSNARDLARFAFMMISGGRLGNQVFLKPETIRLFTTAVDPHESHTRALGWDTKSPAEYSSAGSHFGPNSFGHTGFTGTSIWIDPDQALYVILLTNRVYPSRKNRRHIAVRPAVADLVFSSIRSRPASRYFTGFE